MLRGAWLVLLVAVACSGDGDDGAETTAATTVASCRSQYSVSKGYGHEDDLSVPTAPPGDAGTPPTSSRLDQVVAECQSGGGAACDKSAVLTHDAAICVAKAAGLADGIASLKAGLAFHVKYLRIVWNVQNTLHAESSGAEDGDLITLDAIDGSVLKRGQWGSIP